MNLRLYAGYTLLVLALFMPACASIAEAPPEPEPIKLKVMTAPFLGYAPFFIAQEEGYFTEQGLDIEFVQLNTTAEAVPALAQGDLDVIAGDITISILNAIARGETIKIVADKGYFDPDGCVYQAYLARRDLVEAGQLDDPAQLRGRRIAVTPLNVAEYYLEKILSPAGLTLDDVVTENMPHSVRLEAIQSGAMDIVNVGEPWVTRILRTEKVVLWRTANEVIPNFQAFVIYYGPNLLEKNPEAGRRFMVAYLQAVRQYNQGKTDRNLEILAKHTGLERELLQETCWSSMRQDGAVNADSVLEFQAWALEKGALDQLVPEEQFLDRRFVEQANQILDTTSE